MALECKKCDGVVKITGSSVKVSGRRTGGALCKKCGTRYLIRDGRIEREVREREMNRIKDACCKCGGNLVVSATRVVEGCVKRRVKCKECNAIHTLVDGVLRLAKLETEKINGVFVMGGKQKIPKIPGARLVRGRCQSGSA